MKSIVTDLIKSLQRSKKWLITCPDCCADIPSNRADLCTAENLSKRAEAIKDQRLQELTDIATEIEALKGRKLETLTKQVNSVNAGKLIEKFAPILDGFDCAPLDCHAIYEPIDYIVFHGHQHGDITNIELIDIKSGGARLTGIQRTIKGAIEEGNLHFSHLGVKP